MKNIYIIVLGLFIFCSSAFSAVVDFTFVQKSENAAGVKECGKYFVHFEASLPDGSALSWVFDVAGGSAPVAVNKQNTVYEYSGPGEYEVSLTYNGTTVKKKINIEAIPAMTIEMKTTVDKYIDDKVKTSNLAYYQRNFISSIVPADSKLWDFYWTINGDTEGRSYNFEAYFYESGDYTVSLMAERKNGSMCITPAADIDVTIDKTYDIPNVITPNDDGVNDELKVINPSNDEMTFTLFSKHGALVKKITGKVITWTGDNIQGDDLPAGIYYYILEISGKNPEVKKSYIYIYR